MVQFGESFGRALVIPLNQTVRMQLARFTPNFHSGIMNDYLRASRTNDPPDDPLPAIGEQVLVQAEGFRCLTFRDKDGKWRNAFSRDELHGTIRMIKFD